MLDVSEEIVKPCIAASIERRRVLEQATRGEELSVLAISYPYLTC